VIPGIPLSQAPSTGRTFQPRFIGGDGIRYYSVPFNQGQLALPGATSILRQSDTVSDNQRLEDWRLREIAAGRDPNAGRDRGTRVHALMEQYLRTGVIETDKEEDEHCFSGLEPLLSAYDSWVWSERPLQDEHQHAWSEPGPDGEAIARVWSTEWGFAGVPDIIGKQYGQIVLSDLKTSNRPYYRPQPGRPVPSFQQYAFKKYVKCVRQLCLYAIAIEETLGLKVDRLQILVALPEASKVQMFYPTESEFKRETETAKRLCQQFWESRLQRTEEPICA